MADRELTPAPEDHYDLLQVSPRADPEVIEAAYRVLARRYHPDVNRSPDATVTMARLNAAWDMLRDPEQRAVYDETRNGLGLASGRAAPTGWAAHVAAERDAPAPAPSLTVTPERLAVGPVRQGLRRSFPVTVETQPPGIRVTASVAEGSGWLAVSPAVLKGLHQDSVTVELRTERLRTGPHRGTVELSTSWESRALPVELQVTPAPIRYRLAALMRSALGSPLVLGVLALLVIIALLTALALR